MQVEPPKCPPSLALIEDDPNVAALLTLHLERQGWCVRVAGSLAAARELFCIGEWDLIILDRRLPDGDGVELCAELRAAAPHGYILILTGESSDEAKLKGFECGADDYVTKPFQIDELIARIRAGLRIVTLQKALLTTNRQLEKLSVTDCLTHLRNRRAFDQEIASRFEHAKRYLRPLSVAVIDVDHFKSVNDQYGHAAGDTVLRGLAEMIEDVTRGTDFVARYGGEEFAVILPETPLPDALRFAEKLRKAVAGATIRIGESAHEMTISLGVASVPYSEMHNASDLVRAADQALYRAKKNGRNRVEAERRTNPRPAIRAPRPEVTRPRSGQPSLQQ